MPCDALLEHAFTRYAARSAPTITSCPSEQPLHCTSCYTAAAAGALAASPDGGMHGVLVAKVAAAAREQGKVRCDAAGEESNGKQVGEACGQGGVTERREEPMPAGL